jgi:hypothetical protein
MFLSLYLDYWLMAVERGKYGVESAPGEGVPFECIKMMSSLSTIKQGTFRMLSL